MALVFNVRPCRYYHQQRKVHCELMVSLQKADEMFRLVGIRIAAYTLSMSIRKPHLNAIGTR